MAAEKELAVAAEEEQDKLLLAEEKVATASFEAEVGKKVSSAE